jgi:hypothetical protein
MAAGAVDRPGAIDTSPELKVNPQRALADIADLFYQQPVTGLPANFRRQ